MAKAVVRLIADHFLRFLERQGPPCVQGTALVCPDAQGAITTLAQFEPVLALRVADVTNVRDTNLHLGQVIVCQHLVDRSKAFLIDIKLPAMAKQPGHGPGRADESVEAPIKQLSSHISVDHAPCCLVGPQNDFRFRRSSGHQRSAVLRPSSRALDHEPALTVKVDLLGHVGV